jgi:tRNA threonylcarbamoyladenosine biosynthesis protein TsaE
VSAPPAGTRRRAFLAAADADTAQLGAAFGAALRPLPDRALRCWLAGDLGAGKTTFARGLLRQLGVTGAVRSPTYSLIERHEAGPFEVVHGDLYRLEGATALAALGLDDFDRSGAVWLIEWPERGQGALPPPDLQLDFSIGSGGHRIEARAGSDAGRAWLARAARGVPWRARHAALELARPAP